MLFSFWSLKGTTQDIRTGAFTPDGIKSAQGGYKVSAKLSKVSKSKPAGGWLSSPLRDGIFQPSAPGGFKGTAMRGTCSPRGQKWGQVVESAATVPKGKITLDDFNESLSDSIWSKWCYPAVSFMHRKPKKRSSTSHYFENLKWLKLSPGRLWRLGGFQRLDTSSVFWPGYSLGASFVLPAFSPRKSKGAAQRNPYQEKLLSGLKEKI